MHVYKHIHIYIYICISLYIYIIHISTEVYIYILYILHTSPFASSPNKVYFHSSSRSFGFHGTLARERISPGFTNRSSVNHLEVSRHGKRYAAYGEDMGKDTGKDLWTMMRFEKIWKVSEVMGVAKKKHHPFIDGIFQAPRRQLTHDGCSTSHPGIPFTYMIYYMYIYIYVYVCICHVYIYRHIYPHEHHKHLILPLPRNEQQGILRAGQPAMLSHWPRQDLQTLKQNPDDPGDVWLLTGISMGCSWDLMGFL